MNLLIAFNSIKNSDGWGIFNHEDGLYFKSKETAASDKNLEEIFSNMVNTKEVLIHCRAINDKSTVKVENSHPFIKKHIVFAHNGSLNRKTGGKPLNLIDSEDFANQLDEELNTNPDMYKALVNTYSKYTGKFAFLIYDIDNNEYYAARGDTANLHKANFCIKYTDGSSYSGYIINTEKETLSIANEIFNRVFKVQKVCEITLNIEELPKNSVFKLNKDDVIKLGEMRQENIVESYSYGNFSQKPLQQVESWQEKAEKEMALVGKVIAESELTYPEIIIIMNQVKNYGNSAMASIYFYNILGEKVRRLIQQRDNKIKRTLWKAIKEIYKNTDILDIYRTLKLEFPYFMNSTKELKRTLNEISVKQ